MAKRRIICTLFLSVLLLSGCRRDPYEPELYLSDEEETQFIKESVFYSAKLPPKSNPATRYNKEFASYYERAAQETKLIKYYRTDSADYFLMTRVARSINPMREGIGGKLRHDAAGKMDYYEEVFRTWKMVEDSLNVRGPFLFDRMVKGKDLSMYSSKFQGDRFIEFPDDRFFYDPKSRTWRDRALDSLQVH